MSDHEKKQSDSDDADREFLLTQSSPGYLKWLIETDVINDVQFRRWIVPRLKALKKRETVATNTRREI